MSEIEVVLERQWRMLQDLSNTRQGLSLQDLAKRHRVSEKTIKRDIKSIELVFGKLTSSREEHGRKRYVFDRQCFSFTSALERDELLALYIGQTLMEPLQGTPFWDSIVSGREKIAKTLRTDAVAYAERVAPFFYRFEPTERNFDERRRQLFKTILTALDESNVLRFRYRSLTSNRAKTYDVCPYSFVYWQTSVYLVGYCCLDKKIKIWKVDRLVDAKTVQNRKFKRPVDFNVDDYLANVVSPYVGAAPVVLATLRFTGYAARLIQEERPRNVVSSRELTDGSVVLELETEGGDAFIRWLLGYGANAEVISPPKLRDSFLNELAKIRKNYLTSAPDPVKYVNRIGVDHYQTSQSRSYAELRMEEAREGEADPDASSEEVYEVEIYDPTDPNFGKPPKKSLGRPRREYYVNLPPLEEYFEMERARAAKEAAEEEDEGEPEILPDPIKIEDDDVEERNNEEQARKAKRRGPMTGKELATRRRNVK